MKCSHCEKESSPPNARFCVDCGYALRQACPYDCGHRDLPVRRAAPLSKCPGCGQFLTGCPLCFRLHRLSARACSTSRCQQAGVVPVEPFAFHAGTAGGAPLVLTRNWHNGAPSLIEPGAKSLSTAGRFGALASRYGLLAWWKDARLNLWPAPRPGEHWPQNDLRSLDFFAPPPADGVWPAHQGLLLAHGHAYALHGAGASRVPLNEGASGAPQPLVLASSDDSMGEATDEFGLIDVADFDSEAPLAGARAVENWALSQVEWLGQAASAQWWLGVGHLVSGGEERLVGARARGQDALFEGERWALPAAMGATDWREVTVWNDAPVLRARTAIWREKAGAWQLIFALESASESASQSLDGALCDGDKLWVWGRQGEQLWVRQLDESGRGALISMALARSDAVFPFPVVRDSRITFAVAGALNAIVTLDVAHPLADAQQQVLPAMMPIIWLSAVAAPNGAQWLVYAGDDGDLISFWLMPLAPRALTPLLLDRLRPLRDDPRDGRGAVLGATVSGDALVLCCATAQENWLRAFRWGELGSGIMAAN